MKCIDANRAFVLYASSMVNKYLYEQNSKMAFEFALITFYDTYQMIEEQDLHYK